MAVMFPVTNRTQPDVGYVSVVNKHSAPLNDGAPAIWNHPGINADAGEVQANQVTLPANTTTENFRLAGVVGPNRGGKIQPEARGIVQVWGYRSNVAKVTGTAFTAGTELAHLNGSVSQVAFTSTPVVATGTTLQLGNLLGQILADATSGATTFRCWIMRMGL